MTSALVFVCCIKLTREKFLEPVWCKISPDGLMAPALMVDDDCLICMNVLCDATACSPES